MEENWEDETADGTVAAGAVQSIVSELPEIKLFGKWSCDDVEVVDMSLQVRPLAPFSRLIWNSKMMPFYLRRVMCLQ
jgi:hypothetical protein